MEEFENLFSYDSSIIEDIKKGDAITNITF